jgi:hypothetical protein
LSQVEVAAKMEGRNMISIYVPDKAKIKEYNRKLDLEKKETQPPQVNNNNNQ